MTFLPNWESLCEYRVPAWYDDAKFGIFIHWGVYSVPAFGSEWYSRNMYQEGSPEFQHHVATYGPHTEFGYKDFIPQMTYTGFDPAAWASLFEEAGAKFVVPVAEHHDGFAMYDTDLNPWCAAKMGPKRDLLGDLADAIRARGMTVGVSSHRAEHFWFFDGGMKFPSDVQDPAFSDFYGPAEPGPVHWHDLNERPPTAEYMEDWLTRTCELVDRYKPQVVWFDWWIQNLAWKPYLQRFAAYYYNRGEEWGLGVAINYKYDAYPDGTAVFDVERGQLKGIREELWQNDTSVSKNSWGYVAKQEYKTAGDLIGDLIDVVSKHGALLLNIGPKADGTIPEAEQQILRQIGGWLKVSGEAIYGTRPWKVFGEGPTEVPEGAFTDTNRSAFTGQDIRFTANGDVLYAIALAWPDKEMLVKSLAGSAETVKLVTLLGHEGPLDFEASDGGLVVKMPPKAPNQFAYAFKITR